MICTEEDDFVRETQMGGGQAVWVAGLSSGQTVYQDDGRPGVTPYNAWKRLCLHCGATGDRIERVRLLFRGIWADAVPAYAEGYFLIKAGLASTDFEDTFHFLVVGWVEDGVVRTRRWKIPELYVVDESHRSIKDAQDTGLLILYS